MVFSKSSGCHRLERPRQGALSALSSSPHLLPLCLLSPSDFSSQSIVARAGQIHGEVAFNLIRDWFSRQLICVAASIRVPPALVTLFVWRGSLGGAGGAGRGAGLSAAALGATSDLLRAIDRRAAARGGQPRGAGGARASGPHQRSLNGCDLRGEPRDGSRG